MFSIRYKFLLVTTILLIFCVSAYLLMATTVFRQDKTELVYDYNKSIVSNISSDIETMFNAASDKLELAAFFLKNKDKKGQQLIYSLLENNSDIVFVTGSFTFKKTDQIIYSNKSFFKTYGIDEDMALQRINASAENFKEILEKGESIWNASISNEVPLIGYGKSVVIENEKGEPIQQFAVLALIKIDKLIKSVTRSNFSNLRVFNKSGELLVGNKKNKVELFKSIRQLLDQENIKTSVFKMNLDQEKFLGAYSKSFSNQIVVISDLNEKRAFLVVDQLVKRSVLFALILLTLTFIVAILFSRSLTNPIQKLVSRMEQVAEGDLDSQINIKTRDEINLLANSFNLMIDDLKSSRLELEEMNKSLEQKVKERTLQLEKQNQVVKQAQEALLRTTRLASIGEIAGRAAHEVLNPLTNIFTRVQKIKDRAQMKGEVDLITDLTESWQQDYQQGGFAKLVEVWQSPSKLNPSQNIWDEDIDNLNLLKKKLNLNKGTLLEDIKFLAKESQRINRIVQSMRSLSHVQGDAREHLLNNLLEESVNIMADLALNQNIKLEWQGLDEVKVEVDIDEFIQSITNLIRNSLQSINEKKNLTNSSFQGFIKIIAEIFNETTVNIMIIDNGVGISEKNKNKLFEKQFSTKEKSEGTGLGLSISRRFIRAFGGDIFLQETGHKNNTVFIIQLPIKENKDKGAA